MVRSNVVRRLVLGGVLALLAPALVPVATAATVPSGFAETRVVTGLDNPTTMAIAPDGRFFIAEQDGDLRDRPRTGRCCRRRS